MTQKIKDIEKLGQAALDSVAVFADSGPVRELITQLEETKADLSHANSILIKIEKLLEGVEYRGDYAEGVRVLKDSLEAAERDAALYRDLICQVERKFPDETRHETAFRYIRQAEAPSYSIAAMKEKP